MSGLKESLAKEMMMGYLRSTISKPMVRRMFSSIEIDEDVEEIDFELREPLDDDSDSNFVEEVLVLGMVLAWVDPKYHSTLLTAQFFGNSEQRYYSQSAHLSELKAMYEKAQTDLRKIIRDRGYSLSYINGVQP